MNVIERQIIGLAFSIVGVPASEMIEGDDRAGEDLEIARDFLIEVSDDLDGGEELVIYPSPPTYNPRYRLARPLINHQIANDKIRWNN